MAKRVLEGFNGPNVDFKYRSVVPRPEQITRKHVKPMAGSLLDDSSTIKFNIKASELEMIRMTQDPFLIEFSATYKNPNYTDAKAAAAAAGHDDKYKEFNIDASKLTPKVYINRLLEGNCFFSKIEVELDGQTAMTLTDASLEDKQMFYQSVHRVFDNSANRREIYGDDITWISNTKDREVKDAVAGTKYTPAVKDNAGLVTANAVEAKAAIPIQMSEAMKVAVRSLTFDDKKSSMVGVLTAGVDGIFPMQLQNSALKHITGQKIENKFLHPECEILITLHKRVPLTMAVEKSNVSDADYYSGAAQTDPTPVYNIKIRDMTMAYESMIVDRSQLAHIKASKPEYYFDAPIWRRHLCAAGSATDVANFNMPAGTKLVYLFWTHQDQTTWNETNKSFLSTRFRFPPNNIHVRLDIPGVEGVVFKDGLRDIGIAKGHASQSLRTYVADLIRKKCYSKTFDDFFPPQRGSNIGYDSVILADMTPYNIKKPTILTVNSFYVADYLPPRWELNAFCIVQNKISYSNGVWTRMTLI